MIKHLQKIISFILIVIILLSLFETSHTVEALDEIVEVNVSTAPKVNILLTQNETEFDLKNFEPDLKAVLRQKGMDTSNVTFQAMEQTTVATSSEDVDFAAAVNSWKAIGSKVWHANDNGQVYIDLTAGTSNLSTNWTPEQNYASCNPGWYGEALINDREDNLENLQMSFTLVQGGTLLGGPCFNVKMEKDGTLSGYFFYISAHSGNNKLYKIDHYAIDDYFSHGANKLIWCSGYNGEADGARIWFGDTRTNIASGGNLNVGGTAIAYNAGINKNITTTITCLAEWNRTNYQTNAKYVVTNDSETGRIVITVNGTKVVDLYDKTYTKGTYGFWGNNCEQKKSMYLNNLQVTADKATKKTYNELLNAPTWDDEAVHIIVNVDDSDDTSLNTPENIARTLADKINFIQWGSSENEAGIKDFIKNNDGNGIFLPPNTYAKDLNDTADYIIGVLKQKFDSEYVIAGRPTTITVVPSYLEEGATSSLYPNGRWITKHDCTYFDNNLGQSTQTDRYTPDLKFNFDKPGKYEIYFDDELVKSVYAHREPIADFSIKITGTNLTLTSKSYDLDKNTNIGYGNGIAKETWYYKDATAASWTEGKLNVFDNTKVRMLKLEVEDYQGEKASTIKYIGKGNPVANFNLSAYTFSKYGNLQINDTSYDPQGYEITGWNWTLKKQDAVISTITAQTPTYNFKTLGTGEYTLTLSITNNQGKSSGEYTRTFNVIDDTDPATVLISPTSCENEETQDISLSFSDADSGFNKWRYAITKNQTAPTTGWSAYKTNDTDVLTINQDGDWYLHLEAYDIEGNLMERTVGAYKIRHDYTNTYKHVLWGLQNGEGNFADSQAYLLGTTQKDITWGNKFVVDSDDSMAMPNGYYLVQKYGTADINGTYTLYNFETEILQDSNVLNFEMHYYPTEYTITYDLAGGKLNGTMPAKYTVLYGVTYPIAEKVGYTFEGWYDQNGNRVTGVNEGKTAEFTSTEEIYQELASRQTGNIHLTARWEIIDLPLEVTADNTANNNQGRVILDWSNYPEQKAVYKTYRHDERQGSNEYAQMTYIIQPVSRKTLVDTEGKDVKAPTKPVIELTAKNVYSYTSEERGSTYKYYVESYDQDNMRQAVQTSNIAETTVESGFKEYRYLFDDEPDTVLTATSGMATTENSITFTRKLKYFHIAAVDNAGNVSETATAEIQQYQDYTINYYLQNLDGETYTLDRTVTRNAFIGTDTISELNEHDGFTTPEEQVEQVDVDVVVINYYYERNRYTIELDKVEGVDNVTGAGTYYYGEEVTIDAEVDDRYQWINWTGSETIDDKTHTIIVPSTNLAYTANALLKTKVEVKYIDKNTGEELAETIVYTGLYGDSYDVSSDKKEIAEFTLIEEPEKTGIMVQAEKVLTYYYAKTTDVTVKYLEQDTLDELQDTIVIPGYEALPYEIEEKGIEGYTLVKTIGNLNGEMPREASEVVYYYLKDTSVTVKYIDKNNGEEIETEVLYEGLFGDAFDVTGDKLNIKGYTLLEEPIKTGTMPKEPLTLIYYYAKDTQVTVKYLEQDTLDELATAIIMPGYETKEYETKAKIIAGYTLVLEEGQLEGTMPREHSTVTYYYLKDTSVTVKYIDKNTGEQLSETNVYKGLYGDSFDVVKDKKEIEAFTLIEEPEKIETMPKEPITLVYYYAKTQKVTVRHIEKDSGEELAETEIIVGYESKPYIAKAKEIPEYTSVSIAGMFEGRMPRKDLTVVYYYLKNTSISIKYIDKNTGEELASLVTYTGLYGDRYNIGKDVKGIEGYTLMESPEKIGTMEKEPKTLTYYYAKNTRIIVDYIEENTGRKLSEEEIAGYEGKEYVTAHKNFEGYTLVDTKGQLEGAMPRETTRVKYYYLKDTIVQVNYKDKRTEDILKQSITHTGLFGDPFNISEDRKIIAGYTLIEEPETIGIMNQVKKELTYYYAKNTEMKIRFIEENSGKDLALMKIINGYEGKEYSEEALEIEGYTLVTKENKYEGVMDRNPQELNFYYLKNTTVKVQYIDKNTEIEIAKAIVHGGLFGEYYDISKDKKEINGYKLVEEPKTTGNMEENEIVLTYYYTEIKNMKIQFIDMHTGEALVAQAEEDIPETIAITSDVTEITLPVKVFETEKEVASVITVKNDEHKMQKTQIVAKIPEGIVIDEKENSEWKITGTIATLEISEIQPEEEKTYTLVYEIAPKLTEDKEENHYAVIIATGIVLAIATIAVIIRKKH